MHHLSRKRAHLIALVVHRGGGARIEYLQGDDKLDEAQTGGTPYPTVSPCPFCFSTRMSNNISPDGCFSVIQHQLRRPIT